MELKSPRHLLPLSYSPTSSVTILLPVFLLFLLDNSIDTPAKKTCFRQFYFFKEHIKFVSLICSARVFHFEIQGLDIKKTHLNRVPVYIIGIHKRRRKGNTDFLKTVDQNRVLKLVSEALTAYFNVCSTLILFLWIKLRASGKWLLTADTLASWQHASTSQAQKVLWFFQLSPYCAVFYPLTFFSKDCWSFH